jgi:hypothetical protein
MVAVREITWEEASAPGFETTTRQAWREAVQEIADRAKQTLPECNGRVDKAVALVLHGDVELLADGKAQVASQSNSTTEYVVCNGTCECKDFPKAPSGWCKHRIAAGIHKRAQALVQKKLSAGMSGKAEALSQPAPTAPLPEAPVSITLKAMLHGHEVLVTLRGVDFASVKRQVEDASQWLQAQSGHAADDTAKQCPKHGVPMKLNHGKNGSTWYSHKTAEGWCKGK